MNLCEPIYQYIYKKTFITKHQSYSKFSDVKSTPGPNICRCLHPTCFIIIVRKGFHTTLPYFLAQ